MKRLFFTALLLHSALGMMQAQQGFHTGFKTGINFSNLRGPSETGTDGAKLETFDNLLGFHIGATFAYNFVDNFGLRGEFLYSRRGLKYSYDGPMYRFFQVNNTVSTLTTSAKATYQVSVNNSYIDIPVMAFVRLGKFELSAGGYAGILIQSNGIGEWRYTGAVSQPLRNSVGEVVFILDHNYLRDKPGEAAGGDEQITASIDRRNVVVPKRIGAYFDQSEDLGNQYRPLDYGLLGGVAFNISRSLFASARLQYGLADITNNAVDVARSTPGTALKPVTRDDEDRNFLIQASIGFSF
jgi:Outer membrane protein beta-barrel domain